MIFVGLSCKALNFFYTGVFMLKKIIIQNFQSHKNTVIDLEKMTVIYGLSDSGKSALRRAIQCVVNKSPFYLRTSNNVTEGSIVIEFDDYKIERNVKVKKIRKCPNCKYELNGESVCPSCAVPIPIQFSKDVYIINDKDEYERFGIELPEHIQKELGFYIDKFDTKSVNYNVMSQFDDMFFIGKTYDSIRNKMINLLVPDSDIIGKTIQEFKEEKNNLTADVRTYTTLIKETETKISNFNIDDVEKISEYIGKLESYETELANKKKIVTELCGIHASLTNLNLIDEDIVKYSKYINNFVTVFDKIKQNKNKVKVLKELQESLNNIHLTEFENLESDVGLKLTESFKLHSEIVEYKKKHSELLKIRAILNEISNSDTELGVAIENAKLAYETANKQYLEEQKIVVCPITNKKCQHLSKA